MAAGYFRLAVLLALVTIAGCRTLSKTSHSPTDPNSRRRTETIILMTLDGVRTQEMFVGYDLEIGKTLVPEGKP